MEKIAVFPGSFDPLTLGHVAIIQRALPLFDKIVVGIGSNSSKQYMFDINRRTKWIKDVFNAEKKVSVEIYSGLTVDFCENVNARYILRGIRNSQDFEYEKAIAQMNKKLNDEIESIFLCTNPELSAISSTIVRDIIRNNGDAGQFLPWEIKIK